MDKHLQQLAATHLETKFIKVSKNYTETVFVKEMVIEHRPEQLLQNMPIMRRLTQRRPRSSWKD